MPARSIGRARAGFSRSTTAPHKPGSAGPTGFPGARPARASQTLIRVSTYVTCCLSLADGEWRLWVGAAGMRVHAAVAACITLQSAHKGAVGGVANPLDHIRPPLGEKAPAGDPAGARSRQPASESVAVTVLWAPLRVNWMVTLSPTLAAWMAPTRSSELLIDLPFTAVITSPCCRPAFAAALLAV